MTLCAEYGDFTASGKGPDAMGPGWKTVMTVGSKADEVVERLMDKVAEKAAGTGSKRRPKKKKTPLEDLPCIRSNAEVAMFQKRIKGVVWSACTAAGMPPTTRYNFRSSISLPWTPGLMT